MNVPYLTAFVLIHLALHTFGDTGDVTLDVKTTTGMISGKIVTGYTQKQGRAFLGIPYAEPPVGELRFTPPVPIKPWTDVFDATKESPPCYQTYTKTARSLSKLTESPVRRPWSEDCLTINLWVPVVTPEDAPVVIFIHGGSFMTGSGSYPYFDMSTFSVEADEVLISFNYRLGAFGFLSMGTSDVSGNVGLMDQQLALKWIRDNVHEFGGKVDAIFFVGFGAGAASIGHQIIYENNAGLFKTAVIASGSPICPGTWHTKEKAVELAKLLSDSIGCGHENSTAELECLQNAHPDEIVDAYHDMSTEETFKPNLDGSFIKEDPLEAMKAGRINNVTVIAVSALNDASLRFYNLNRDILTNTGPGLTREGFDVALKRSGLDLITTEREAVHEWYLHDDDDCPMNETEIRDAAVHAYSDGLSVCCTEEFLSYATQKGVLTFKIIIGLNDPKQPSWIGAHDNVFYPIMTAEALNPALNFSLEVKQSAMGMMYTSKIYARKKAKEFQELVPLYNLEERPYLHWGDTKTHAKNYRTEECALWNSILPALRRSKHSCDHD